MTTEQDAYYAKSAASYDSAHVKPGDEHFVALEYMVGLFESLRIDSVLDVGAGTGRATRFLAGRRPGLHVVGVEPVAELRTVAQQFGCQFLDAAADELPFEDDSFDAVIATGLMHHLPKPEAAIREMTRVAARAVMISDSNRFGQGSASERVVKAVIYRLGLWPAYNRVRTRGRGHLFSEGDGVFYSYSVYDSAPQLASWADNTFVIPTFGGATGGWFSPLLTAPNLLLVAVRQPAGGWAGLD